MRPVGYGNYTLESLTPELRPIPDGEVFDPVPTPHGYRRGRGIPVEVECGNSGDHRPPKSFMTWWKPNWRDIWDLLRGGQIRVSVNYSLYGPLDLDVVTRASEGTMPGRRIDW